MLGYAAQLVVAFHSALSVSGTTFFALPNMLLPWVDVSYGTAVRVFPKSTTESRLAPLNR